MTNLIETQDIAKKFSESFVLVRLQLSRFGTEKIDKEKSKEYRDANNVTLKDAGKWTKKLLPKSASMEALKSHDDATWSRLKRFGAPFAKGVVMIPVTKFMEATAQLRQDLAARDPLIRACGENYNLDRESAKAVLGTTFKEEDYLTEEQFLREFYHELDVLPVSNPSDMNLAVLGEAAEAIQQAVNETYTEKVSTLAPHIRFVLLKPLSHLAKVCQGIIDNPKVRVFNSAFSNVHDAASHADGLNVFDDDQIRNAVFQIDSVIPTHGGSVKGDPIRAKQVLSDVTAILASLDSEILDEPEAEEFPASGKELTPSSETATPELEEMTDSQIDEAADQADLNFNPDALLAKLGW